ncbi:hypothetical protein JZ751_009005 [Albula glossodonta]|uniref:Origin recognition complex subunit 5 C-terminal domain-containing protein n=1 Tax=Albula glossodonta TaxID=121402 RepID=A0A8T2P0I4_9TELE|nr:hypothetical protein JZ751_009005 [Albula glossodonta]
MEIRPCRDASHFDPSAISSLVTLQLLSQVSHDDQLDAPKYKCTVSLDFIRAISRTVGFDIVRYLYDFL